MQGSGTSYAYSGETTEWEDILIKKGITTKSEVLINKGLNPFDVSLLLIIIRLCFKSVNFSLKTKRRRNPKMSVIILMIWIWRNLTNWRFSLNCWIESNVCSRNTFQEDEEFSDTHMLDQYRQRRLQELQKASALNRFGDYMEIVKDDWVREVTEGSNTSVVVVHLYENSMVECQLVDEAFLQLAPRFKYVKFLKIKYTQAIENWPERNLPTIFIYDQGALKTQILTLKQLGGKTMKTEGLSSWLTCPKKEFYWVSNIFLVDLEWFLVVNGILTDSELQENPRAEESRSASSSARKGKAGLYGAGRRTGFGSDDENDD